MVVFAGISASDYLSDVWVLSLAPEPTWAQLEPTGQAPGRRFEHSAIYDPVRHRMIVYGGLDQLWVCDDLWGLSLDGPPVWGPIQTTGARPPAAAAHQAIYDPVRDRMILSGGYGYIVSPSSQSWALSLASPAWTLLAPAGPAPLGLSYHVAIDDPRNDQMVVFDGDGFDESWEMRWGAPASRAMTPLSGSRLDDVEASAPRIVPNPAHGDVAIGFALARGRELTVRIYDVAGRSVCTLVNGYQPAGPATFRWDRRTTAGALAPPGLYFCVVRTNERASVERFVLIP
jgi:hypothetical protein